MYSFTDQSFLLYSDLPSPSLLIATIVHLESFLYVDIVIFFHLTFWLPYNHIET